MAVLDSIAAAYRQQTAIYDQGDDPVLLQLQRLTATSGVEEDDSCLNDDAYGSSSAIEDDLDRQLQQARQSKQAQSDRIYQLESDLATMQIQRDELARSVEILDDATMDLLRETTTTQEAAQTSTAQANSNMEILTTPTKGNSSSFDADEAPSIARLQQQMSLYATCTGVDWDYLAMEEATKKDDNILAGTIDVPSQSSLLRFCLEDYQQQYTRMYIASYLWNAMSGKAKTE